MNTVNAWKELQRVVQVLDQLDIPYVLGGSLASSLWGAPRSTNDADLIVAPFSGREELFAAQFTPEFYLSLPAMREANLKRRSFNIINTTTGFKTDIFVSTNGDLDASAFRRKVTRKLPQLGDAAINVLCCEDVIIRKLDWYRQGGETSDRQWSDVLGVLRANLPELDQNYLLAGCRQLGAADLLSRAIAEAGDP